MKAVYQYFFWMVLCHLSMCFLHGQGVGINATGQPPHVTAGVDIDFPDKGLLIPRLTSAQRDSITNPALGLQIFNLTTLCFEAFFITNWQPIYCGCVTAPSAPTTLLGPTAPTLGATVSYSIVPVAGATGYVWNLPAGWTLISGQGSSGIQVTIGPASGTVSVVATNACGSSLPDSLMAVPWRPVQATGGATTTYTANGSNGLNGVVYKVHRFNAVGNASFVVSDAGTLGVIDYFIVAGGGGGGRNGGGGGGGVLFGSFSVAATNYPISVGSGGLGGQVGTAGQNSSAFSQTAVGGGGGGGRDYGHPTVGGSGGGGAAIDSDPNLGASGTIGQGFSGGNGGGWACGNSGGGGGGAGGSGGVGTDNSGGIGGIGSVTNISGMSETFGGGGGGAVTCNQGTPGNGGLGGGGNAGIPGLSSGQNGTNGLGGGGGACLVQLPIVAGNGGSGTVIIRYPITNPNP